MQLTSPAFENGGVIPRKYSQWGEDVNPPLAFDELPIGTISLALTMDDPDVPPQAGVPVWDHWVVFNIPRSTESIPENWEPVGIVGKGTRGMMGYSGPKPPDREHRYFFRLYALDTELSLPEGVSKKDVLGAMGKHVLATAELIGRFSPS